MAGIARKAHSRNEHPVAEHVVSFESFGDFGRFGNQLFQIAATIGAASINNCGCWFPAWEFESSFENALPRANVLDKNRGVFSESAYRYKVIRADSSVTLRGYFQSERYFAHCAQRIRKQFAPAPVLMAEIEEELRLITSAQSCSLHIRRGDYAGNPNFTQLWETDYYARALRCVKPDAQIFVFSDDPRWCKRHFKGSKFRFLPSHGAVHDFFLMVHCKQHIIANSSFSWWAAWLGEKKGSRIIAPKHWFAGVFADPASPFIVGPPHGGFHDIRDLVPSRWHRI